MIMLQGLNNTVKQGFRRKIGLRKKIIGTITKNIMTINSDNYTLLALYNGDQKSQLEKELILLLTSYAKTYNTQTEELKSICGSTIAIIEHVCSIMQTVFNCPVYNDITKSNFYKNVVVDLELLIKKEQKESRDDNK